ncbi:methyltransferase [Bowmanella pacifica]|uniref:Ribosomal RNA large subunit methyltransferase G n=1 Tax=Bowmanella pacifica TaxID=502051 RepID=A0A918DFM2_9ALTE|nr:methyltransferase [Bowmanella pacifica]GGO64194.1 ribosomal RNA large subunit methyltransferase G [Bowmanella pacifica]
MKVILTANERSLKLQRYPARLQDKNEQAWDAADELLLEQLQGQEKPANLLIFNDDCGALGCFLAEWSPAWISDSKVSHLALQQNLSTNDIPVSQVRLFDSLSLPEEPADMVLMKIPKTLALLEHQLIQLQSNVDNHTRIIAAAKANQIQKSTLALFEKYLGPTHTSLARKKARLIFCQPEQREPALSPYPTTWQLEDSNLTIHNHANVFARSQLDIGARFLLKHLPNTNNKRVIDLGCGNGVLGLSLLAQSSPAKLLFVDESYMAVASAKLNVSSNLPEKLAVCDFIASNCLEQVPGQSVDLVLCNPPFHQQQRITDHIAWQMFSDARQALRSGGELRIVGNRHLGYQDKLKRLFGGCRQVAVNNKFVILSAFKK